ncbi:hypothetical protein UFOVP1365_43 [uncultured Caudovirales phage]|uniref:Uncharacterized protein n=1 Tax=uncultured Caudovirales phage TaxID=2100421 RepID=A0A6J5S4Y6_9CAUD|nr:hypothetical protein UFOVP1365_43 [uncultured Caudovirales phage]
MTNQHNIYQVAKLLKLRVLAWKEPTTGYWSASIGHDNGIRVNADTCTCTWDTKDEALDMLLLMARELINEGRLKE